MVGVWIQVVASLLGALLFSAVSGLEIFTPEQVEAVNGSDVRLKCTFSSTHAISPKAVTVSWNFRPLDPGLREESVFHYQEVGYPPSTGRFKEKVVWSGDVSNRDASITLQGVPPTFNGTYTCQVRNPPDVHGNNGEIILTVVDKVSLSDMALLAAIAGGACALILLVGVVFVLVKRKRRRWQEDGDMEMPEGRKERKDPTVCSPEDAIHLTIVEKVLEVDSSDGGSEPSSGDDDEEEEEEEDDDDDDDEDDDDDDDDGGDD